jgi:ATP-dependent helicase/nuclease subunit B
MSPAPTNSRQLLRFVEHKIAQLADQIIAGDIGVTPYRIARQSPCEWCDFRSVCRFDVSVNHYHHMAAMKRTEVLDRVVEEVGGHGSD